MAAAATRGRRATKKTCASTLLEDGSPRSNTFERLIEVLPSKGARRQTASVNAPNPSSVTAIRRRMSLRPGKRHHGQVAGARMKRHVGLHVIQLTDVGGGQDLTRVSLREHAAASDQNQFRAQRRRQIQIVR